MLQVGGYFVDIFDDVDDVDDDDSVVIEEVEGHSIPLMDSLIDNVMLVRRRCCCYCY